MPLRNGYSRAVVQRNIAELLASGVKRKAATAAAHCHARQFFFRQFPGGAIPQWLAGERGARTARHYSARGAPVKRRALARGGRAVYRKNPIDDEPDQAEIDQAAKLIEDFSGHQARSLGKVPAPKIPKVAIAIGNVLGISYETKRDGQVEKYYHRFTLRSARPLLVSTPDGKQLFLLGGAYDFTERGIVDKR